jgi:preprotein translocase subunit SecA
VLTNALKAIFGSRNDRLLKQYRKTVESINALEPAIAALSTGSSRPRRRS